MNESDFPLSLGQEFELSIWRQLVRKSLLIDHIIQRAPHQQIFSVVIFGGGGGGGRIVRVDTRRTNVNRRMALAVADAFNPPQLPETDFRVDLRKVSPERQRKILELFD